MSRVLAVLAIVTCLGGCFGYNKSAKRWSYAGNTVLILGGGGVIAADLLTKESSPPAMMNTEEKYKPIIDGGLVAGALLVTAGIVGMIVNATRPNVKTSR